MRYEEEQASSVLEALELMDLHRAIDASLNEEEKQLSPEQPLPFIDEDEGKEEQNEQKQEEIYVNNESEEWSKDDNHTSQPRFHSFSGLTPSSSSAQSPLQCLQLFLTSQLLQQWTQYTNEYAHHIGRERDWSTTPEELYCFIGVHIYMGICDLPSWHMYYSEEYQQPFISSIFSQARFGKLLQYFHVAPYTPPSSPVDPLSRVRPFLTHLNHFFPQCYSPSQFLTIDEAMVAYKGRSAIKQYIPSKPHKWGYKIYCLASEQYLLHFEVYEGKSMQPSQFGAPHDLVLRMTLPYCHQSFILFTDSWFTSPTLLSSLHQRGIRLCGSVRTNRKGLPAVDEAFTDEIKSLQQGEWMKRTKGNTTLVIWKDQKLMWLLFNHISSLATSSVERWNESRNKVSIACPRAVHDYFHHARSVDVINQLHYSYLIGRKSMKPWFRLAWWCIDMCIINAFILYKMRHPDCTQLSFRQQLMHELVDMFHSNRHALQVSRGANVSVCLARDHYSELSSQDRDCFVCSDQSKNRKRTNYICRACNKYLCIGKCFTTYHARV